jgi:hypothetical protein
MSVFVWGVFPDPASAQRAVDTVIEARFPPEEISVLTRDARGAVATHRPRHATRAPVAAVVGAVLGCAAMLIALSVPDGFGGPLRDLVQLGIVGALLGAFAGGYGGLLWWRREAAVPDAAFERGAVVVGVTVPEERVEEARRSVRRAGASELGVSAKLPPR